jgi:phage terminase small subunit
MTARQRRFVAEYLVDGNGTQAAIRAGYSKRTARKIASEILTKPDIRAAVAEKGAKQIQRLEITADMIAARAWEIAHQDKGDRTAALALLAKRHPEFSDKHEWLELQKRIEERAAELGLDPIDARQRFLALAGGKR